MENALKEIQYHSLFDAANDAIFIMDGSCFVDCNGKVLELFRCTRKDIIGVSPADFSPEFQPGGERSENKAKEKIEAALTIGPQRFEWRHCRLDKTEFDTEVSLTVLDNVGEKRLLAIVRDVTDRKLAEETIRKSEAFRKRVFDTSHLPMVVMEYSTYRFIDCNPAAIAIYRLPSREEVLGKTPVDVSAEVQYDGTASSEKARYFIEKAIDEGAVTFEWLHRRSDGELWDAEVHLMSFTADQEQYLQFSLVDVTERKKTEELMRLLRKTIDVASDGVYCMDTQGRFTYVNESACRMLGYSRDELLNMHVSQVNPTVNPERWAKVWETIRSQKAFTAESIHRRKDGSEFPVEIVSTYVSLGEKEYVNGFARDITGRKKLESDLRNSRANLSAVLESTTDLVWSVDCDFRVVTFNTSVSEYFIKNYDTVIKIGDLPTDILPTDKAAFWIRMYRRAMTEGAFRMEYDVPLSSRCLELSFYRIFSEGETIGISIFVKDVTERKKAEQALKEEKMFSDAIINTMPGIFYLYENGERLVKWNKNHEMVTGFPGREGEDIKPSAFFDTEIFKMVEKEVGKVMSTGSTIAEFDIVTKDHGKIPMVFNAAKVSIGDKEYLLGTGTDISDLKKAEAAVRESEERFRQIADNIEEVFFLLDKETRSVLYASPAIETLFGISIEKVLTSPLLLTNSIHPDDRETCQFADLQKRYTQPINETFRIIRSDGDIRWVRLRSFLVFNDKKEVYRIAGIVADITDAMEAQEASRLHQQQLIQADKMASVGIMVSGVAHEINNPNNLIMLNADVMKTIWEPAGRLFAECLEKKEIDKIAGLPAARAMEKFGSMIDGISGGSVRIKRIVENLKDFARIDTGEINEHLQINDVIETALQIVYPVIKKASRNFSIDYGENIPKINGNYQKLEQVFINLITNACQSLENCNKAIRVCTEYIRNDKMVKLNVSDEGRGIDREHLDKIFDPFFTTKRDIGGTGLGMSVSYGIIREHKGTITIQSTPGTGTSVSVLLPTAGE